jgi:lysozyme
MAQTLVIDLSHHNSIPSGNLLGAKQDKIAGVIHKMTEGSRYIDPMVPLRCRMVMDQGLEWGIYHFMRPGDMVKQARFFVESSHAVADDRTLYAADYEDEAISLDDLKKFLITVQSLIGRDPVLYSGHVLKEKLLHPDAELSKYRLWLAQYSTTPVLPPGWTEYWLWQYTQSGKVPGIDSAVDMNLFFGTADQLRRSWAGVPSTSPATPSPEVTHTVTVTIEAPPGVSVIVKGASS